MKTKIKSLFLLHLIVLFTFSQVLNATIINVPADQATIQAGITASTNGDTVLVQPGTYNQNINFNGKNITVGSLFLTTGEVSYISETIINGGNSNSVVKFNTGESNNAVLCGFTITNGSAYYGAGINCYSGASPTLHNLVIIDNHGFAGDSYGGALCFMDNSNAVCSNLTITNNSANEGGGIFFHNNGNATMSYITMTNNTSAHGGAMQISYSDPVIDHSVFYENNSPFGGAVYVFNYSTPVFTNCTFSLNEADYGGAFYCSDLGGAPIITNCIFWNDESLYNNEIFATSSTYPPVVTYSNVENGTGQFWFGTGCIAEDPLFVDAPAGDFHLLAGSPCIDAGDPDSPPDPDGSQADMGAFYFVGGSNPGVATNPVPAHEATGILLNQMLMWTNGENTTQVDLFFDTINPPVNQLLFNEPATTEQFNPNLQYQTTYYWRVDCVNEYGATEGNIWSFTTGINTSTNFAFLQNKEIVISPNPANEVINIKSAMAIIHLAVFNSNGQIIYNADANSTTYCLNVGSFKSGLYIFRVTTTEGTTIKRVVIN